MIKLTDLNGYPRSGTLCRLALPAALFSFGLDQAGCLKRQATGKQCKRSPDNHVL